MTNIYFFLLMSRREFKLAPCASSFSLGHQLSRGRSCGKCRGIKGQANSHQHIELTKMKSKGLPSSFCLPMIEHNIG